MTEQNISKQSTAWEQKKSYKIILKERETAIQKKESWNTNEGVWMLRQHWFLELLLTLLQVSSSQPEASHKSHLVQKLLLDSANMSKAVNAIGS